MARRKVDDETTLGSDEIDKTVRIGFDSKQFIVRFPMEVAEALDLSKGDKFRFFIKTVGKQIKEEKFEIVRGKK